MQRIDAPEILDSGACSGDELQATLKTLDRINRWFGGVATTQKMVEHVAEATGTRAFSLLETASGSGYVPLLVRDRVARRGISLAVTLLDRAHSHLISHSHLSPNVDSGRNSDGDAPAITADALALPFRDAAFDLVSCNLFAHHLSPQQLAAFVGEALRVSRVALLVNDLVRHPMHLGLVYASLPLMSTRVAWLDGLTSVRRAYTPIEIRQMVSLHAPAKTQIEITRNYLFRMGVIVWKKNLD
ncbi:MAG: methyltransferase domain-containing protein [Candidatus Sulfotelmatobacter sp.]